MRWIRRVPPASSPPAALVRLGSTLAATAAVAFGAVGCTADASTEALDGPAVERWDSAGVEIVAVGAEDRVLGWTLRPLLTLGGEEEGPEGFYRVARGTVAADAEGRIYVLDPDGRKIQVFDTTGTHLRSMGGEGHGPGEFRYPAQLHFDSDSTLAVWDHGRRGLVRLTREGEPLEAERLPWMPMPFDQPFVRSAAGGLIVATQNVEREPGEEPRGQLLRATDSDTAELAAVPLPTSAMISFPDCGVGLRLPPIFHPELVWDAGGDRIAWAGWPEYRIVIRAGGEPLREIRREIAPLEVGRATALEELGEGMPIRTGGDAAPCRLDPVRMVDGRGFAEWVPTLSRLASAPDGTLWVRRRAVGEDVEGPIDLFGPDGDYLGTLPPDFPDPLALLPGDRILTSETDDFDVDRLVLSRIER